MQIPGAPILELGQKFEQAIIKAAELTSDALRLEKLAKRVYAACYLSSEGTVAEREARARTSMKFIEAEDAWLTAQHDANIGEAQADALKVRYESWRTTEATKRAEMQIR